MCTKQNRIRQRATYCIAPIAIFFMTSLIACSNSEVADLYRDEMTAAQDDDMVAEPIGDGSAISVGGTVILKMREDAGGYTAEERAHIVRRRLVPIRSMQNLQAGDVMVVPSIAGEFASIYVRDHLFVTVTTALAEANNSTPEALANLYAERLRQALPRMSTRQQAVRE
jgi:hypothetical protein